MNLSNDSHNTLSRLALIEKFEPVFQPNGEMSLFEMIMSLSDEELVSFESSMKKKKPMYLVKSLSLDHSEEFSVFN